MTKDYKLASIALFAATASSALAGSGQLNVHTGAGLYINNSTSYGFDSQDYSGAGSFGPIAASSNVVFGGESIQVDQSASANIVDELTGSISFTEGWTTVGGGSQGFANFSPNGTNGNWASTYNFTTTQAETLTVSYKAAFTGSDPTGFGLWNAWVYVDGTLYAPSSTWVTPISSGSWTINLATTGAHSIQIQPISNISAGVPTESLTLNQTISWSATPAPEPMSMVLMLGGAVGLLRRKRA